MSHTKVVILGTGTPSLQTNRYQSSAALIVDDQPYIVDCGSGSLQRQMDARAMGLTAFDYPKLTRLFITHLHPDHTLGIPAFIISNWVKGRTELQIYGPKGVGKIAYGALDMFAEGIAAHQRTNSNDLGEIKLDVVEHEEGVIYADDRVSVEAFRVKHGQLETYGLKFVTADQKSVIFSSDTQPVPIMAEKAKGCDILVHSVYCQSGLTTLPPSWDHYFSTMHTSGRALGKIAAEAQPQRLVLTHQIMYEGAGPADVIREIREGGFKGQIDYANDMDVYNI